MKQPKFKIEKFKEGKRSRVFIDELVNPDAEKYNQYKCLVEICCDGGVKEKTATAKKLIEILEKAQVNIL